MAEQEKIAGEFSRLELAQHLEALAKKLKMGKVRLGEQDFLMPELLTAKIKLREKAGQVKVKLRLAFPVQAALDAVAAQELARRQVGFKEVKKRLGAAFGELLKSATSMTLPEESQVKSYLELSAEFTRHADPAWGAEMQEYLDHVENLRLAFENRQVEMFQHELRDLQNRMKICHRDFK
jgi:XXXCH domain-containing protein